MSMRKMKSIISSITINAITESVVKAIQIGVQKNTKNKTKVVKMSQKYQKESSGKIIKYLYFFMDLSRFVFFLSSNSFWNFT